MQIEKFKWYLEISMDRRKTTLGEKLNDNLQTMFFPGALECKWCPIPGNFGDSLTRLEVPRYHNNFLLNIPVIYHQKFRM